VIATDMNRLHGRRQNTCVSHLYLHIYFLCPARREGGSKRCFRPSVCPSVTYIANNSRTYRSSVPKFRRKVPHLWWDWHTSSKVKWSQVKVTSPINADTHRAPYFVNGKAYELQTWFTNGGRRPALAADAMTSKVKCQGHKLTSSVRLISASS